MSQTIKVGIASYGMSGSVFHLPLLHTHKKFTISKILERTSNKSVKRYPYITIVKTFEELLNDKNIELLVINTPDNTHYDFTKKALQASKNVIVEKPFTLSVREGEELIKIAEKHKKILSVYQNRRWDSGFLTIKKVIENNWLGRLVEYESHYDRFRNYIRDVWKEDPKVGTGIIYNLGSHMIDQVLVLFGMPNWIYADIRKNRTGALVDDFFDISLGYKNFRATIKSSYLVKEPGPQYILHGTEGSFVKFGGDPQEKALSKGEYPDTEEWGKENEDKWGILNNEQGKKRFESCTGSYMDFYQNIFEAIRQGKKLEITAQQALNVIRIIEYAKKSNKEGKRIVIN